MKRMKIIFLLILILMPVFTFADCDDVSIRELTKKAGEINLDIDFKKAHKNMEVKQDYYLVKTPPFKDRLYIEFYDVNTENHYAFNAGDKELMIPEGGMINVRYVPFDCVDKTLRTYSLYLPSINKQEEIIKNSSLKKAGSKILLVLLILCILVISSCILVLIKKKRKKENSYEKQI